MTAAELLNEWQAHLNNIEAARRGNRPNEEERLWDQMQKTENKLHEEYDLQDLSQDQVVQYLDLAQRSSWDIPSALMGLCGHLDEDEYFWMHRGSDEERAAHPNLYPAAEQWEPADKHFKEEHGWDLKDKRINWSFDT